MNRLNPYRAAGTFIGATYIERSADQWIGKEIFDNQRYPYISAPRQSGKSSLLARTRNRLDPGHFLCAFVDLSPFRVDNQDLFVRHFLEAISRSANLPRGPINPEYMEDTFLAWLNGDTRNLIVFVDEIDVLVTVGFKVQFLSAIRSLFNQRAMNPTLCRLQFVLSGAVLPSKLISDGLRSPFNVGVEIPLLDLTRVQVAQLAGHLTESGIAVDPILSDRLYEHTGGLVYLSQLTLERMWDRGGSIQAALGPVHVHEVIEQIVREASRNDHFTTIFNWLRKEPALHEQWRRWQAGTAPDPGTREELRLSGLCAEDSPFRNKVYERVFGTGGPLDLASFHEAFELTAVPIAPDLTSNQFQRRSSESPKPGQFAASELTNSGSGTASSLGRVNMGNAPFNVPYEAKGDQMVGRVGLLERVREQFRLAFRTHIGQAVSFQGLGGLGKTQTAVEYAHRYREDYPGGVIWLFADQDIDAQLTQLAVDAGWVPPESEHSIKLDVARHRLNTYPGCLLILDNVEDFGHIQPYLPSPELGVHIIVTSRQELPAYAPIAIHPLSRNEALTLLLREADREGVEGPEAEAALNVVIRLDGLPLALEIAGAYLRHRPAITMRQYLELMDEGLKEALPGRFLQSATHHLPDLFATLRLSERLLAEQPQLRDILTALVEFAPVSMSTSLVAALLGETRVARLTDALSLGVKLRILRPSEEQQAPARDRYRLHRLVWTVLREEHRAHTDRQRELGKRLVLWLMALREDPAKLAEFEAEIDHLHEWEQTAVSRGWPEEQVRCLWLQGYPPFQRGQYRVSHEWVRRALDLYKDLTVQDEELKANLLSDFAISLQAAGGSLAICLEYESESLGLRRRTLGEEHPDTATSWDNVGSVYGTMGQYQKALEYQEMALELRRRVLGQEHPDTASSWDNVGFTYGEMGQHQTALEYQERALELRRRMLGEEHPDTASSWNNVGSTYGELGQHQKALEYKQKALALRRRIIGEEHPDTATSWNNVGVTYGKMEQYHKALEYQEKALELRRRVLEEDHPTIANSWNNVGFLYGQMGQHQKALEYQGKALELFRRVLGEEHPHTLDSVQNCAAALWKTGKKLPARELLQRTLQRISKQNPAHKALNEVMNSMEIPGFRKPAKKTKRG